MIFRKSSIFSWKWGKWGKQFTDLMNYIDYIVFGCGFWTDVHSEQGYARLKSNAEAIKFSSSEEIKAAKAEFIKRISQAIESDVYPKSGYNDFKDTVKATKESLKNKYNDRTYLITNKEHID